MNKRALPYPPPSTPAPHRTGASCAGNVCISFTDVDAVTDPALLAEFKTLLSDEESRRHEAFHFAEDRHLYLVAHALLRTSLSCFADTTPQAWQFVCGEHGRPELAPNIHARSTLRFNLSHTRKLAACAITNHRDLGIDVEYIDRPGNFESIAARYFAPSEIEELAQLSGEALARRFFEYWTLKEAFVKACGGGLTIPLDGFSFHRNEQNAWQIEFADSRGRPNEWQFACVQPTPCHLMSIALHCGDQPKHDLWVREVVPLR